MRLIISDKVVAGWQAEGAQMPSAEFAMAWQDDDGNTVSYADVPDETWQKFLGCNRPLGRPE